MKKLLSLFILIIPAILWANSYIEQTVPTWMEKNQIPGVTVRKLPQ